MKREYRSFKFLLFFVIKGALPLFVGWMTLCLESFIKISEHKATGTGVTQCQDSFGSDGAAISILIFITSLKMRYYYVSWSQQSLR